MRLTAALAALAVLNRSPDLVRKPSRFARLSFSTCSPVSDNWSVSPRVGTYRSVVGSGAVPRRPLKPAPIVPPSKVPPAAAAPKSWVRSLPRARLATPCSASDCGSSSKTPSRMPPYAMRDASDPVPAPAPPANAISISPAASSFLPTAPTTPPLWAILPMRRLEPPEIRPTSAPAGTPARRS